MMENRIKIYLASPYTNGDKELNTQLHIKAFKLILDKGYICFAPLLSHYSTLIEPELKNYSWLDLDLEFLKHCQILIRLTPTYKYVNNFFNKTSENDKDIKIESPGADLEEKTAKELGIKVFKFDTIEKLSDFLNNLNNEFEF